MGPKAFRRTIELADVQSPTDAMSKTCFETLLADSMGNRKSRLFDSSDPTVTFQCDRETRKLWQSQSATSFFPQNHSYHIDHHINPAAHRKVCITNSPEHKGLWQQDWSAPGKIDRIQKLKRFASCGALAKVRKEESMRDRRHNRLEQSTTRKQEIINRCYVESIQSPSSPVKIKWRDSRFTKFNLK